MNWNPYLALGDITPKYLRDHYLTGLTLMLNGAEMPDPVYEEKLRTAMARLEEFTLVDVLQRVITAEENDYHIEDYARFAFIKLKRRPTLSVQQVRAVYPTGQSIQVFDPSWYKLDAGSSSLFLVPTQGTVSQIIIGQGGDFLPLIYGGVNFMPHLWQVDYTTGMDTSKIPRLVVDALCKLACIELLLNASDTIRPPGVTNQSLSLDGMSQSRGYQVPAFKARIDQYRADLGLPGPPTTMSPPGQQLGAGLLKQIYNTYYGLQVTQL